jgi:hypothetical protein
LGRFIDLTGKTFGRLKVISKTNERTKDGSVIWDCICECGNKHKTYSTLLLSGQSKSCGCLQKEIAATYCKNNYKKYNTYNLTGEYGIGYTSKDEEFYFDIDDYTKIKDVCWCVSVNGYLVGYIDDVMVSMHRIIKNPSDDSDVDHINHNKLDNRKINLRECTRSQNLMNKDIGLNNTSGYKGVYWSKNYKKWEARIFVNNSQMLLGYYDSFDEAVQVRKEAEEQYFGEYSYDNSMKLSSNF